ncbi:hypothetical protein FOXYSP1_15739 [Fusarium oxysporum f. sp. phaseoli]
MFERLPQELLKFIISELTVVDIYQRRQNTSILLLCRPVIPAWIKNDTYGIDIDGFPVDRLVFTKSIGLRFVTENNARACPHDQRLQTCQEASDEETVDELGSLVKFKEVILSLLEKCEKEQLTSFRFYDEELEDWTDLPDMMISERDKEGYRDDPTSSPLYPLNLDFIELSCEPINLLGVLNPFSRKDCLRIVHVRQSRKNMEYTSRSWGIMVIIDDEPVDETPAVDEGENPSNEYLEPMFWAFVEWAFSYKGIKSLEYILFGDYGRPEQMSRGNLLICREGYGSEDFRIIRESCPAPKWDYVKKE